MKNAHRFATLTSIVVLAGCGSNIEEETGPELRPARVHTVTGADSSQIRSFSGVIHSAQESRLSFKVGGTVISLPVQAGSALKPGDTIARIDASTFELELEQARAKLAQADASLRNSQSSYNRVKGLYENSGASKDELDLARANAETAEAEVRAANKSVELAELNQSYTLLRASGDCTVASIAVEQNENVSAGEEIAIVNCGDALEVHLGIPESLIGRLSKGMAAQIQPNIAGNKSYSGKVTEIGVGTSSSAATFPVVVAIEKTDKDIRPNMAAQVSLDFGSQTAKLFHVPTNAVVKDGAGTHVFLAVPTGNGQAAIKRQMITVGALTSQGLEVIDGLSMGDLVVTAGLSSLREGQPVLLPGEF